MTFDIIYGACVATLGVLGGVSKLNEAPNTATLLVLTGALLIGLGIATS